MSKILPSRIEGGVVQSLVEGANVTVDNTDPAHPVINATGGGGGGGTPTFHGCGALRTVAQSIPYNTLTIVTFTAADQYDTDAIHDPSTSPSRFTVPAGLAGIWRFTGAGVFAANTDGDRMISWFKNGVNLGGPYSQQNMRAPSNGAFRAALTTSIELNLAAGDYVEMAAYQLNSATTALNLDLARCTVAYLGAV